ncbi:MAG: hypothetical protein ACK5LC_15180 [Coprobacillaceae bacterium]
MLHYLPGCDVRKNHSKAVLKMETYMKNQNASIERCCRVKNKFLFDGDTIIQNCTLCDLILKETHPDNTCLSLYEYVLEDENFPWVNHKGEKITIQDCWRTKDNLTLQKAIRKCLLKMNFTIMEMEENYDKTKFCGVWLNNEPAKDCIEVAPKTFSNILEKHTNLLPQEEQVKSMHNWVSKYTTKQIAVYCNGCEKGVRLGGGNPIHMIELLAEGLL